MANETAARPPINVLVVDDEESQRNPLAAMIAAWGFVVEKAGDGQEALEKLTTFPANVIITDLMMPRLDGATLIRRVREEAARAGRLAPLIFLTSAIDGPFAMDSSAPDAFVPKPFNLDYLEQLLDQYVSALYRKQ